MTFLRLQYTRSDGEIDTYHLKSGRRYHVGRGSACEVRILDMRLSRKHCALEAQDGHWALLDLGSTNGCKINNQRIVDSAPVSPQTTITLGSVNIFIESINNHLDETPAPATQAQAAADAHDGLETNTYSAAKNTIHDNAITETPQPSAAASSELDLESDELDLDGDLEAIATNHPVTKESAASKSLPEPQTAKTSTETSREYNPTTSKINMPSVVLNADANSSTHAQTNANTDTAHANNNSDTQTVFISALGKKIGPISRDLAKELKKRELQGTLTEEDVDKIINETH